MKTAFLSSALLAAALLAGASFDLAACDGKNQDAASKFASRSWQDIEKAREQCKDAFKDLLAKIKKDDPELFSRLLELRKTDPEEFRAEMKKLVKAELAKRKEAEKLIMSGDGSKRVAGANQPNAGIDLRR